MNKVVWKFYENRKEFEREKKTNLTVGRFGFLHCIDRLKIFKNFTFIKKKKSNKSFWNLKK